MPSYFLRNHQNGLFVTSHKVSLDLIHKSLTSPSVVWVEQEVVFKNGNKRSIKSKTEIRVGFFPVSDPEELDYHFGDEVPVSITHSLVTLDNDSLTNSGKQLKIYWADFDGEKK